MPGHQALSSRGASELEGHLTQALITDIVSLPFENFWPVFLAEQNPPPPHNTHTPFPTSHLPRLLLFHAYVCLATQKTAHGICAERTKGSAGGFCYTHVHPLDLGQPANPRPPGVLRCGEAVCFSNVM